MKAILEFVRTTLIGGLVFMVPVVVIIWVVGKALQLSRRVAEPLSSFIPLDTIGGIAVANIMGILVIVLACFLAGLAARTTLASSFVRGAETRFLMRLPGYSLMKGLVESVSGTDSGLSMHPVLMKLDDSAQLAFEVERLDDGRVVVYVPDAPEPRTGSVMLVKAEQVEVLPVTMMAAMKNIQTLGRGTAELLDARTGKSM